MIKINSKLLCGFLVFLSASFTSIYTWAEQTKFLSPRANTKITQQTSISDFQSDIANDNPSTSSDLGFEFAHQLLNHQENPLLSKSPSSLSTTQPQGITVSVATLMKPTNLPGRYLGNSKVTLVHY
ncbi:MAG: hypothetical protein COB04_09240 [Gammaproteobacteria bacterium]|nr:MAG: hypothetical protein COB04_09240 [Gammaproteobacteria bacterium]